MPTVEGGLKNLFCRGCHRTIDHLGVCVLGGEYGVAAHVIRELTRAVRTGVIASGVAGGALGTFLLPALPAFAGFRVGGGRA